MYKPNLQISYSILIRNIRNTNTINEIANITKPEHVFDSAITLKLNARKHASV